MPAEAVDQSFVDMAEARAKGSKVPKSYKPMHQVDAAKDLSPSDARCLSLQTASRASLALCFVWSAVLCIFQASRLECLEPNLGWTSQRAMVLEAPPEFLNRGEHNFHGRSQGCDD